MKNFENILVYRIGHLGDTLVSLPAFWAIRRNYPNARITLLTNSTPNNPNYILAQSVLPKEGLFDDWLNYPSGLEKLQTAYTFGQLFREMTRRKFDALFYLTTRNRTVSQIKRDVLFFRSAGIKNIIGTKYLLKNLLDSSVSRPLPRIEKELDFLLNCLKEEGVITATGDLENSRPDLKLDKSEISVANKWLEVNAGKYLKSNCLLAVAPSGKWDSKIWAEASFQEVVGKLIQNEDVYPVIFGGSEDREKGNRLIKSWKRGANAAGVLNIREAAAALSKCRIYLGNDTGTMHLAASIGIPCVAIFSAIDWAGRWQPYGENHKTFRFATPCEGCLSSVCKFQNDCLKAIKAEDVYAECAKLWQNLS